MKILILSQTCYPEPDLKTLVFARELKRRGHGVEILTGIPNYPGGKIYQGYKFRLYQTEFIDGIKIIRVILYPSHDKSVIKRVISYLSFAFSAAFIGTFMVKKADIGYVYHPPATIAIPAIFLRFLRGIPIVYDIQDMWPDSLSYSGMVKNKLILRTMEIYCNLTYKIVNRITCLSPGIKELLVQRGVPASKVDVIYNWAYDLSNDALVSDIQAKKQELGFDKHFTILYAGNLGPAQAMTSVLDAAALLRYNTNILFAFIGAGIDREMLIEQSKTLNLPNVVFLPKVPSNEIGVIMDAADVLLVHLKSDILTDVTLPSKIQAYLKIGKPILLGVTGDAADLIHLSESGIVCQPENAKDIAEKVLQIFNMTDEQRRKMGKKGSRYYQDNLSIEIGTRKFLAIFNQVIEKKNTLC